MYIYIHQYICTYTYTKRSLGYSRKESSWEITTTMSLFSMCIYTYMCIYIYINDIVLNVKEQITVTRPIAVRGTVFLLLLQPLKPPEHIPAAIVLRDLRDEFIMPRGVSLSDSRRDFFPILWMSREFLHQNASRHQEPWHYYSTEGFQGCSFNGPERRWKNL